MTRRWAWAWMIGAVLLFGACDGVRIPPDLLPKLPTPAPLPTTPAPEPTPPSPVCAPPGLVFDCWHMPPGQGWQHIPAPPPLPVPSGCAYPVEEGQLAAVIPQDGVTGKLEVVLSGERALGDLRDPKRNATALARANHRKLAVWLRGVGECAFVGQEALFVQEGDVWAEIHAAAETDGGWTQHPYVGDHRLTGPTSPTPPDAPPISEKPAPPEPTPAPSPAPTPTPAPKPTEPQGCNAPPCPRIAWTRENLPEGWGDNEIGRPAWQFNSAPYPKGSTDRDRDFTPIQRRNPAFCEAVGFNAPVIADCPLGKDGDPLRPERERYLLAGGFHREGRFPENDASCEPRSGAPSMIRNGTGCCRMCDSRRFDDPLRVCSDWF